MQVSVSVGDSMTFFYRRLPPLSRRKSGVQIVVDKVAAKNCEHGDIAHNRYKEDSRMYPYIFQNYSFMNLHDLVNVYLTLVRSHPLILNVGSLFYLKLESSSGRWVFLTLGTDIRFLGVPTWLWWWDRAPW